MVKCYVLNIGRLCDSSSYVIDNASLPAANVVNDLSRPTR